MLKEMPRETSWIFSQDSVLQGVTPEDEATLRELALNASKNDAIFVEVGSWVGYSACVLGEVAKRDGGQVFCIDHWRHIPIRTLRQHAYGPPRYYYDTFPIFMHRIEEHGLNKVVHPLVMKSATAATIFSDGIADMVFIDADHRYEGAKQDIELWWPKVKEGGILCGHDCEGYYSDFSLETRKRIDETSGTGYTHDIKCHSGVIKALHDYFGHKFSIEHGTTIWYKRKVL